MNSTAKFLALAVSVILVAGALILPLTIGDHTAFAKKSNKKNNFNASEYKASILAKHGYKGKAGNAGNGGNAGNAGNGGNGGDGIGGIGGSASGG